MHDGHRFTRPLAGAVALAFSCLLAAPAAAQDKFPSKPMKLVTQFGPGGATDLAARAIAEAMTGELGQSVVVEGRPGAGGQIAVGAVRDAAPDGYTLLFGGQTALVTLPIIDPATAGNPLAEFKLVGFGTEYDLILITGAGSGIRSVKELVERLKGPKGNELTWATIGVGTPVDMAALYFLQSVGAKATAVPYKGPAAAHPDLVEGRLTYTVDTPSGPAGLIKEKRMLALAVFSRTRSPFLPDVPTFIESGFPAVTEVNFKSWNGIVARKAVPTPVVDRLNEAMNKGMAGPRFKERVAALSQTAVGNYSAGEAQARLDAEVAQWKGIIPKMGLKPAER